MDNRRHPKGAARPGRRCFGHEHRVFSKLPRWCRHRGGHEAVAVEVVAQVDDESVGHLTSGPRAAVLLNVDYCFLFGFMAAFNAPRWAMSTLTAPV